MTSAIGMAKGMNDVERHGLVMGDDIEPLPNGDYVLYTDYAALQQQLAAAREALQATEADKANAARYVWLRDQFETYSVNGRTSAGYRLWDKYEIPVGADGGWDAKFDAAIDAASGATLQRDRQP